MVAAFGERGDAAASSALAPPADEPSRRRRASVLHVLVAATGPFWAPYGPSQIGTGPPLSGMSWAHPFGIDQLGRDVFSRVVHGSHIVMLLSLSGTFLGLVLGAVVGLFSGYVRGWVDEVLQRILEAIISIPFLVLALIAIVAAGPTLSGNPVMVNAGHSF